MGVLSRCGLVSVPVLEILSVGARPRLAPALAAQLLILTNLFTTSTPSTVTDILLNSNGGVIANRSCSFSEVVTSHTRNVSISGTKLLCFASVENAHKINYRAAKT